MASAAKRSRLEKDDRMKEDSEEDEESMVFTLPNEVLLNVMRHLDVSSIASLSDTNKHFKWLVSRRTDKERDASFGLSSLSDKAKFLLKFRDSPKTKGYADVKESLLGCLMDPHDIRKQELEKLIDRKDTKGLRALIKAIILFCDHDLLAKWTVVDVFEKGIRKRNAEIVRWNLAFCRKEWTTFRTYNSSYQELETLNDALVRLSAWKELKKWTALTLEDEARTDSRLRSVLEGKLL